MAMTAAKANAMKAVTVVVIKGTYNSHHDARQSNHLQDMLGKIDRVHKLIQILVLAVVLEFPQIRNLIC